MGGFHFRFSFFCLMTLVLTSSFFAIAFTDLSACSSCGAFRLIRIQTNDYLQKGKKNHLWGPGCGLTRSCHRYTINDKSNDSQDYLIAS